MHEQQHQGNNFKWPDRNKKPREPKQQHVSYKCDNKTDKKKKLDPKMIKLLNTVRSDWEQYAARLEYSDSGKVKYVPPTEFEVYSFDLEDRPNDAISIIIVGKRRTGKTVLTKFLVYGLREMFDEIYVFTKTKVNNWYQKWVPECFVYEGYDADVAEMIWERARKARWLFEEKGEGKMAKILVICDDLLSDKSHRFDETLNALYTAGRHVGISVIYISQKFKGVVPAIRDNSDLVFAFPMFNQNEARQIAEEFLGGMNIRTGMEMLDLLANQEQHSCMVIETWRNCRDPEKFLKIYKADEMDWLRVKDMAYSKEYLDAAEKIERRKKQEEEQRNRSGGGTGDLLSKMRSLGLN